MFNIIKSDFYRIFHGRAIYITFLVLAATIALSIFSLSPMYIGPSGSGMLSEQEDITLSSEDEEAYQETNSLFEERRILKKYPYALDKAIVGTNANLYYFFIVLIVLALSDDFSHGTAKNTIASAISRRSYYFSKLAVGLLLCTMIILFNNFGVYIANLLINGSAFASPIGVIAALTLRQLPLLYGIISLLLCISAVVKRTAIFNTIAIPLLFVFYIALMTIISAFKIDTFICDYEFQVALISLAYTSAKAYILKCTILGIVYILVFNSIGYLALKKAEIK